MMVKQTGFLDYERHAPEKREINQRISDYREIEIFLSETEIKNQASRCMDCGIPYCHSFGCPVKNRIPDFNDLLQRGHWRYALEVLHSTCNFPEITGRVCPAPCEAACTLSLNKEPVTIKHIELQLAEKGFKKDWIQPQKIRKINKKAAVIGSGPAGLSAAQNLARNGFDVTVFEKNDRIGGLLRYGIPDFKLEKWILDRRIEQLKKENINFETGVEAGIDVSVKYLKKVYDVIILAIGSEVPRDLKIEGRNLKGVHFALEYLTMQNKIIAGESIEEEKSITAKDKNVVVIGGGDTGSDCIGTALRQAAKKVVQIELLPKPSEERHKYNPWPTWPNILRTSSSQEEGCERLWSINTKKFIGENGKVKKILCEKIKWDRDNKGNLKGFKPIPDSEFEIQADLVLLAMGFVHPYKGKLIEDLGIKTDKRGNIIVDKNHMTNVEGIYACGDCVLGASLVVKAFYQGKQAALGVINT